MTPPEAALKIATMLTEQMEWIATIPDAHKPVLADLMERQHEQQRARLRYCAYPTE